MIARSDWELIQACRHGEEMAWQHVVNRYKRLVFSIPLNYGLGQHDAADIVQLTFMMLLQGLDGLHQDSHLGGWLVTVARRNSWQMMQRRGRENLDPQSINDHPFIYDENNESAREQWELSSWLHDGLDQLDVTCRALLVALYLDPEQPSYSEVATQLRLAVGSIGPMRARCLHRLRQILAES